MPLAEVIAFEVGSAIAKSILKLWLKDATLAQDISSSLLDLLKARTSDKIAQRRGQWQFEAIGEKVGENLLPLFLAEDHKLDEASLTAVAMAVAETLDKAKISSKLLAERNLEPFNLAKFAMATTPTATRYFSETESALYQRIINESCQYIVDIASQLPSFTERSFAEVLKREDELIAKTNQVLQEIQRMREQLDPMAQFAKFELEYRRAVARNLDVLELYGTDVSLISRRHRLSVAYVTLSVKQDSLSSHKRGYSGPIAAVPDIAKSQDKTDRSIVSVEEALVSARRLIIWGAAGSGKTTLLQWIAIKSASKAFEGQLSSWGSTIPFYIRLRQSIHTGLPAPEAFPKLITPAIADKMPQGWVHNELESGRAIVLVDGLDEVPLLGWEDMRIWLADLIANYPKARFIITSRPHAVEETWFKDEGFIDAELQPMELPDIYTFIDHWHEAVAEELHEEKEKAEVPLLAKQLKGEVERNRSKRNLAANPLLCAMLCALNRDRRQQLPSDRIELYEACCAMLLERRDKERGIALAKYLALNYRQKRVLLEDLAYWLVRNGWSEIKQELVDKRFSQTLINMQGLPQDTTGVGARLLFVERTGFIREPVPGHIDFTHRTFQEFLAAQAALDEGDIGVLVQNAHSHLWRDVIILACGLATKPVCEQLINELIIRGDKEKEYRYQLHLLAISCLETAVRVGPEVREKLIKRLSKLVPPKDMQDARSLAAAGELAVPYLAKKSEYSASVAAACVYALTLIGTYEALETIEAYTNDTSTTVIDELFRAWDYFDRDTYARRVLLHILRDKYELSLKNIPSLSGLQYFNHLTKLALSNCEQIRVLSPLASLTQLTELKLSYFGQVRNLHPLASLTRLTSLNLSYCLQIDDLKPLVSLTQLRTLDLTYCHQVRDLSPIANLEQLIELDLSYCWGISDINMLTGLKNLKVLKLIDISRQVPVPQSIRERVKVISYDPGKNL